MEKKGSNLSLKEQDWIAFSNIVFKHIRDYVIPQYGDKLEDQAAVYSVEECVRQIQKYSARFGKNVREGQEQLDLIKIAHYAQIAFTKLEEENAKK